MELREAARLRGFKRQARGRQAIGTEDRQLAIDDAETLILLEQLIDMRVARFAVGAGVVIEFNEGDLRLRCTLPRACERRFYGRAIGGKRGSILGIAHGIDGVRQDGRIGEQSMPDDPASEEVWCRNKQQ